MSRIELHQEWEKRMVEFRANGQSATAWCATRDISLHCFWYWARKFQPMRQVESTGSIQWLSVKMDDAPLTHENTLTIQVGGASIKVKPGFDPTLLNQVVQALNHVR